MQEMTMDEVGGVSGGWRSAGREGLIGMAASAAWDGIKWLANDYASRDWGGAGGDAYNSMEIMTGGGEGGGYSSNYYYSNP